MNIILSILEKENIRKKYEQMLLLNLILKHIFFSIYKYISTNYNLINKSRKEEKKKLKNFENKMRITSDIYFYE